MAQSFDLDHLELKGEPTPITAAPAASDLDAEPVATASKNGRMFVLRNDRSTRIIEWLDRNGAPLDTLELPAGYWRLLRLSPDEKKVCALNDGYWVIDLARATPTRVAPSPSDRDIGVAWSPDGKQLALASMVSGRTEIYLANADGTGEPELLPTSAAQFKSVFDWSPDGRYLVYGTIERASDWDLWLLPMTGDRQPILYLSTPSFDGDARVSPDGRWLAVTSNEYANREVFIHSFPRTGHKVRVSPDRGAYPLWSRDGKELIYQRGNDVMAVPIEFGAVPVPGLPRMINRKRGRLDMPGMFGNWWGEMEVSADGERLIASAPTQPDQLDIKAILNWTRLMKP